MVIRSARHEKAALLAELRHAPAEFRRHVEAFGGGGNKLKPGRAPGREVLQFLVVVPVVFGQAHDG